MALLNTFNFKYYKIIVDSCYERDNYTHITCAVFESEKERKDYSIYEKSLDIFKSKVQNEFDSILHKLNEICNEKNVKTKEEMILKLKSDELGYSLYEKYCNLSSEYNEILLKLNNNESIENASKFFVNFGILEIRPISVSTLVVSVKQTGIIDNIPKLYKSLKTVFKNNEYEDC